MLNMLIFAKNSTIYIVGKNNIFNFVASHQPGVERETEAVNAASCFLYTPRIPLEIFFYGTRAR